MYHYYNANPVEQPDNWRATFIEDFSEAKHDWPATGPMTLYTDPIFYFVPNIRPSYEEGSQVLWYASTNVSRASYNIDSTFYVPVILMFIWQNLLIMVKRGLSLKM